MKKLFHVSILAVLIFTISAFTVLNAHATGGILSDGPSCASLGGTWDEIPKTCTVSSLTINSGETLTISGPNVILNVSTIDNSGTVEIINTGGYSNPTYIISDTFTNHGTITVVDTGIIENAHAFINPGIIDNNGTISVGAMTNSGTFDNFGTIQNFGPSIINYGTITNTAIQSNNFYSGIIESSVLIDNYGTITNNAIIQNFGTLTNECGATYSGNPPTINPVHFVSCLTPTTTSLSSSSNPSTSGQQVTFASTVSPSAATGTVTFSIDGVPQPPVTLSGGTATISTSSLSVGLHQIIVTYSGDSTYAGSSSAALTQTVNMQSSLDQQIQSLINLKEGMHLKQGIANSLDVKLNAATNSANRGDANTAKNQLGAFINEVNAQTGKAITPSQANQLIGAAQNIINSIH